MTVELSGKPQPLFSAAHPWHQQQNDTVGRAVATRQRGFSGSSRQLIGHLTQVITIVEGMRLLSNECKVYIGMCLFFRFTPNKDFCAKNPSFNRQVIVHGSKFVIIKLSCIVLWSGENIDRTVDC